MIKIQQQSIDINVYRYIVYMYVKKFLQSLILYHVVEFMKFVYNVTDIL